jgi:REP-associated tyrosine transposase
MPFNRKNIRLAPQNYLGYGIYFVTICCHNRDPLFADLSFAHGALSHLLSIAARHSFLLHAFCLMPDHLHILSEGNSPQSNLLRFITAFKQRTALAHRNRAEGPLWQTKFYDHILREPNQLESVASYILANPVRRGLCEDAASYPLSGSQTLNWKKLCANASVWQPPWKKLVPGSPLKERGESPQTGAKPAAT